MLTLAEALDFQILISLELLINESVSKCCRIQLKLSQLSLDHNYKYIFTQNKVHLTEDKL